MPDLRVQYQPFRDCDITACFSNLVFQEIERMDTDKMATMWQSRIIETSTSFRVLSLYICVIDIGSPLGLRGRLLLLSFAIESTTKLTRSSIRVNELSIATINDLLRRYRSPCRGNTSARRNN